LLYFQADLDSRSSYEAKELVMRKNLLGTLAIAATFALGVFVGRHGFSPNTPQGHTARQPKRDWLPPIEALQKKNGARRILRSISLADAESIIKGPRIPMGTVLSQIVGWLPKTPR